MKSKSTLITLGVFLAGLVVGFITSTYGAASAMAEMTRDRDEVRDKLADSLRTVTELAAKDLQAARTERDAAMAELDRRKPKQVKGKGDDAA